MSAGDEKQPASDRPSTKKAFHAPELVVYGTISQVTEVQGSGLLVDNPGADPTKSALK